MYTTPADPIADATAASAMFSETYDTRLVETYEQLPLEAISENVRESLYAFDVPAANRFLSALAQGLDSDARLTEVAKGLYDNITQLRHFDHELRTAHPLQPRPLYAALLQEIDPPAPMALASEQRGMPPTARFFDPTRAVRERQQYIDVQLTPEERTDPKKLAGLFAEQPELMSQPLLNAFRDTFGGKTFQPRTKTELYNELARLAGHKPLALDPPPESPEEFDVIWRERDLYLHGMSDAQLLQRRMVFDAVKGTGDTLPAFTAELVVGIDKAHSKVGLMPLLFVPRQDGSLTRTEIVTPHATVVKSRSEFLEDRRWTSDMQFVMARGLDSPTSREADVATWVARPGFKVLHEPTSQLAALGTGLAGLGLTFTPAAPAGVAMLWGSGVFGLAGAGDAVAQRVKHSEGFNLADDPTVLWEVGGLVLAAASLGSSVAAIRGVTAMEGPAKLLGRSNLFTTPVSAVVAYASWDHMSGEERLLSIASVASGAVGIAAHKLRAAAIDDRFALSMASALYGDVGEDTIELSRFLRKHVSDDLPLDDFAKLFGLSIEKMQALHAYGATGKYTPPPRDPMVLLRAHLPEDMGDVDGAVLHRARTALNWPEEKMAKLLKLDVELYRKLEAERLLPATERFSPASMRTDPAAAKVEFSRQIDLHLVRNAGRLDPETLYRSRMILGLTQQDAAGTLKLKPETYQRVEALRGSWPQPESTGLLMAQLLPHGKKIDGEAFYRARMALGWSQSETAKVVGLRHVDYRQYEASRHPLARERDRLDWSQQQAADHVGLTLQAYQKLEEAGSTTKNRFVFSRAARDLADQDNGALPRVRVEPKQADTVKQDKPKAEIETPTQQTTAPETKPEATLEPKASRPDGAAAALTQAATDALTAVDQPSPRGPAAGSPRQTPEQSQAAAAAFVERAGKAKSRPAAASTSSENETGESTRPRRGQPWAKGLPHAMRPQEPAHVAPEPQAARPSLEISAARLERSGGKQGLVGLSTNRVLSALARLRDPDTDLPDPVTKLRNDGNSIIVSNADETRTASIPRRSNIEGGIDYRVLLDILENELGVSKQDFLDALHKRRR